MKMTRREAKQKYKTWIMRLIVLVILFMVGWINVYRFNNNIYANYERTVEYGRVREEKEIIEPVIAVVLYEAQREEPKNIAAYLNHADNFKRNNVRIVMIPRLINETNRSMIKKLYAEIYRNNKVKQVFLALPRNIDAGSHKRLLSEIMSNIKINRVNIENMKEIVNESEDIGTNGSLLVIPCDLITGNDKNVDFIMELAKERNYRLQIFDVIDTQMAEAIEHDYQFLTVAAAKEKTMLGLQKYNLEMYKKQYAAGLQEFFAINLNRSKDEDSIWPDKSGRNFRLYDRGNVYVRFFAADGTVLFSKAKIGKNKGVVVALIEIARKAVNKNVRNIASYKIYLLTEMEELDWKNGAAGSDELEDDDGVYIKYRNNSALLAGDERPQSRDEIVARLRERAGIDAETKLEDLEFYRFKTVEIENEN